MTNTTTQELFAQWPIGSQGIHRGRRVEVVGHDEKWERLSVRFLDSGSVSYARTLRPLPADE